MGGKENLEVAVKYYCKAAELNPVNVRALYGVLLASSSLCSIGMIFHGFVAQFVNLVMEFLCMYIVHCRPHKSYTDTSTLRYTRPD